MKIEVTHQDMYEKGYREGYAKAMEEHERQDGEWRDYSDEGFDVCYMVGECLNHIPDFDCDCFEEKRPNGAWGNWDISEIRCPECLEYFDTDCYSKKELNRCPNCGADMRGTK